MVWLPPSPFFQNTEGLTSYYEAEKIYKKGVRERGRPDRQSNGILTMIINHSSGRIYDTDRDLTSPERHIVQKMMCWEYIATSLEQFREKRDKALVDGWGDSGPVSESPVLKDITEEMERRLSARLKSAPS